MERKLVLPGVVRRTVAADGSSVYTPALSPSDPPAVWAAWYAGVVATATGLDLSLYATENPWPVLMTYRLDIGGSLSVGPFTLENLRIYLDGMATAVRALQWEAIQRVDATLDGTATALDIELARWARGTA